MANAAVAPLLSLVEDKSLLEGQPNVLRLSLHPGGLAKNIVNLGQWKAHVLWRLGQQIDVTCDAEADRAGEGAGGLSRAAPRRERMSAIAEGGRASR